MGLETVLRLAAGLLLIAANAFFVAVEFALTRLRGLDLTDEEVRERGLETAWELTERLEIHLTGCQLGISSSSVLLGVVAEPAITTLIRPAVGLVGVEGGTVGTVSVVLAVVVLNLVHKIWGEQAPTYLGVERPEAVARRLGPPLAVWSRVMSPVIKLGDGLAKATLRPFGVEITRSWLAAEEAGAGDAGEDGPAPVGGRSELTRRLAELLAGGDLPEDRRSEVLQALRIDEIPARDIMVPADEVDWLRLEETAEDHLDRIAAGRRVRYPVLKEGATADHVAVSDVAGVLYLPSVFRAGRWPGEGEDGLDLAELLSPAFHLTADVPVSELIDRLQAAEQELAVLAEPRKAGDRVVGIVTATDAFEVIAGDLRDPLDDEG